MNVHLISGGVVQNTISAESVEIAQALFPEDICIEATEGGPGWVYVDGALSAPPVVVTPPTQLDYISAAEAHYDAVAQAKNYDDRYTCALRAGYPGPFQEEGQLFAIWMDDCNALGYQVMDEVLIGQRPQPTIEEFLAMLPGAPW